MSDSNFTDCFSKVLELSTWLLLFIFSLDFSTFPTFPLLAFYAFSLLFFICVPCFKQAITLFIPLFAIGKLRYPMFCWSAFIAWSGRLKKLRLRSEKNIFLNERHEKLCLFLQTRRHIFNCRTRGQVSKRSACQLRKWTSHWQNAHAK